MRRDVLDRLFVMWVQGLHRKWPMDNITQATASTKRISYEGRFGARQAVPGLGDGPVFLASSGQQPIYSQAYKAMIIDRCLDVRILRLKKNMTGSIDFGDKADKSADRPTVLRCRDG
jgi:hypothetical protein